MVFTKMHGAGNDYVYVDCTKEELDNPSEVAIKVSDRHTGIGSDGLMEMYNADGSQGKMCGNGIRCVGKYVYDNGLTDKTTVKIDTLAGIKILELNIGTDGKVATAKVNMGCPVLEAADIPMDISALKDYKAVYKDILSNAKDTGLSKVAVKALSEVTNAVVAEKIEVNGGIYEITGVSMGNPHGIVYLDKDIDIKKFAIEQIGPHFESHMAFPERVNTEFIQVVDRKNLNMRVWERGSGETLACGTGACASLVATVLNGMCDIDATLHLLGGDLNISWDTESGNVYMEGPATTVFTGTIEI